MAAQLRPCHRSLGLGEAPALGWAQWVSGQREEGTAELRLGHSSTYLRQILVPPFSGTSLARFPSSPLPKTKQLSPTSPGPLGLWVQKWPLPTFSHSPGGRQLQRSSSLPPCRCRSHTHLAAALSGTALPHPMVSGACSAPALVLLCPKFGNSTSGLCWGPAKAGAGDRHRRCPTPCATAPAHIPPAETQRCPQLSSSLTMPSL